MRAALIPPRARSYLRMAAPLPAHALWQLAATFAAQAHRHGMRKDGRTPYIAHPFRVAMTVRDVFGCSDPAALAAALLHDTIEDTPTDYDDVREAFGDDVAKLVAALTKNMALPEEQREPEYDARLAAADWRARLIKLADQFDNLSEAILQRGQEGVPTVEKIIAKVDRALALARPDASAHPETARAIAALESLRATAT